MTTPELHNAAVLSELLPLERFHAAVTRLSNAGLVDGLSEPPQRFAFLRRLLGGSSSEPNAVSRFGSATDNPPDALLTSFRDTLALDCVRGATLQAALETNKNLPEHYRRSALMWLADEGSPTALEPLIATHFAEQRSWNARWLAIIPPLIWATIAYFAMICICLFTLPGVYALSRQLGQQPGVGPTGPGLSTVLAIRAWMPVWLVAVPVLIAICLWFAVFRIRLASRAVAGLNDRRLRTHLQFLACASRLERAACSDETLEQTKISLAKICEVDGDRVPPLADWAVAGVRQPDGASSALTDESVSENVEFAAMTSPLLPADRYRLSSDLYAAAADFLRDTLEPVRTQRATILIGGALALLVALCVFVPVVELLLFVANQAGKGAA